VDRPFWLRFTQEALSEQNTGEDLRDELEKTRLALKVCKKELSDKSVALERVTLDYDRAQEMAKLGTWVLDVDTGRVTWSAGLHKIFGQKASSPVPTLVEQESWYTEKSWQAMMEAVERTSRDGSPYDMELDFIHRDGSIGKLLSKGAAERDESGKIIRLRGVALDISEIVEAETMLRLALKKAQAAQVYKDQFVANMSHEIRTPMNGIIGFAGLLREENLDTETKDQCVNTIESCCAQLLNLIDDIIEISKIEAGEIKIEKKPFNLGKLIRETAATLTSIKDSKGKAHIRLVPHIPNGSEEVLINSDSLRIQQILINLLGNALKFSEKGTIEFGYKLKEEAVEFFVKDEGIGIDPKRIELIFERFEHLEGTDIKYEGTGLGLSISKGLSEKLEAKLSVESELGVGSLFRLEIPVKIIVSSENIKTQPPSEFVSIKNQQCTVLVVEDELANQNLIKIVLEKGQLNVLYAYDGEEAVRSYREHPEINVVLMDIRMPGMSGDEAAQEILKLDANAKIIAQTAYAMHKDREAFLKLGFVDYISKPYRPTELLTLIKQWTLVQ